MLREIREVQQVAGEDQRRCFRDDTFDLIVWYSWPSRITGFQLCYRLNGDERALTWLDGRGFSHDRIDDGENRPDAYNRTPILVNDGAFDAPGVLTLFEAASLEMEAEIVEWVSEKIKGYPQ